MTGPPPAVQAVRLAVRRHLPLLPDGHGGAWSPHVAKGGSVMVACSGGADSLALLAGVLFETRRSDIRVVGAVVDHGLQEDSSEHTARVVDQMASLGVDETAAIRVTVDPGGRGVEAAAREARYVALEQLADHFSADHVLLGHTLDDQAETVLLGLTRGSGGRSLAGMRPAWDVPLSERKEIFDRTGGGMSVDATTPGRVVMFGRPLLSVTRDQTESACAAEGIDFWNDPHNSDPRFVRSRIRHTVMPLLERELGPGIARALARSGEMLRPDMEALDSLAEHLLTEVSGDRGLDTTRLEVEDQAVKQRTIRMALLEAGAPASDLTRDHVLAVEDLMWGAASHREIQLPGELTVYRDDNLLRFRRTTQN